MCYKRESDYAKWFLSDSRTVTRTKLLEAVNMHNATDNYPPISDRELRHICSELIPVCSCESGYFIPQSAEDLEKFRVYMQKKAYPLFERIKRIEKEYAHLLNGKQLNLDFGDKK